MFLSGFGVSQGLYVRIPGLIWGMQGGFWGSRGLQCPTRCWGVMGICGFQSCLEGTLGRFG